MTAQWQRDLKRAWKEIRLEFRQARTGWWRDTVAEIREFYLTDEQRRKLASKGRFRGALYLGWCVLKGMVSRLSAGRGVSVVLGLLLLTGAVPRGQYRDLPILGGLLILCVLMLELKDKLTATDELKEGRAIQVALLPENRPDIPGWTVWVHSVPANDVGGDLVDVLPEEGDRWLLALGDLAGKGLPAALMMAKLQASLRALASEIPGLPGLAGRLNGILCRDGVRTRFASLVLTRVHANRPEITLVNAGHMPPIHVRADGAMALPKGGMALGLKETVTYVEQTVTMAPGDLFIVYSDGLTEAMDRTGRFYGTRRAMELFATLHGLSAEQAAARIGNDLRRFLDGAVPADDYSLLILAGNSG